MFIFNIIIRKVELFLKGEIINMKNDLIKGTAMITGILYNQELLNKIIHIFTKEPRNGY